MFSNRIPPSPFYKKATVHGRPDQGRPEHGRPDQGRCQGLKKLNRPAMTA